MPEKRKSDQRQRVRNCRIARIPLQGDDGVDSNNCEKCLDSGLAGERSLLGIKTKTEIVEQWKAICFEFWES